MTLDYLLKLSTGAFTGPLKSAHNGVSGLNASMKTLGGRSGDINGLSSSLTSLAAKATTAFAAFNIGLGVFAGFGKSLKLAADMETTSTAFKTLVGSSTLAADVLGKIKKLGAETPFEFPELANAGRMLVAFGEAASDVPDTLRRIGDVASGVAAPIGDIAEIYGKARTAGTLFAEDINQLTGRGIPIIKAFADILKVPQSEVKKLAEQGQITFPMLDQAFRNLTATGGQFFGMMAEQSKTTNGLYSTLKDGINDLFLEFGKPLNDAIKPILTDAIGLAGQLTPLVTKMGGHMAEALTAVRNFVMESEKGGGVVVALGAKLKEAFAAAGEVLMIPIHAAMAAMPAFGSALMNVLAPTTTWLALKFDAIALSFGRAIMQQMSEVVKGLPSWLVGDSALNLNIAANAAGKAGNAANADANELGKMMPTFFEKAGADLAQSVTNFTSNLRKGLDAAAKPLAEAENPNSPLYQGGLLGPLGSGPAGPVDTTSPLYSPLGGNGLGELGGNAAPWQAGAAAPKSVKVTQADIDAARAEKGADPTPQVSPPTAFKPKAAQPGMGYSPALPNFDNAFMPAEMKNGKRDDDHKIRSLRDGSTKAKQTRGYGMTDGLNPKLNKSVQAPGAAKAQQTTTRAASAAATSGKRDIYELVARIAAKMDVLAVA